MKSHRPILMLVKKSFYELYGVERKDPRILAMMTASHGAARGLLEAHEENVAAIGRVENYLKRVKVSYLKSEGAQGKVDGRFSLVISVGGDGTLLAAAHQILETAVVGINSRPGHSVGYFCAAKASDFEPLLDEILEGRRSPRELNRMDIYINGFRKSPPVLNDVLYAGRSPAETTRYMLAVGDREETHQSSGVWVATPAGSTAAMGAAGGREMALDDRVLQYLVREPYCQRGAGIALRNGTFAQGMAITNLTPEAAVYLDGTWHEFPVYYGDVIEPRLSAHPLRIYL
jgi:NAD+ kinase